MTKEFLLKLFHYDKERGVLIWKSHWSKFFHDRWLGQEAGDIKENRYRHIRIADKLYLTHRLIWFIEYGTWPEMIDHVDGNGLNNRMTNLRASTHRRNQLNRKIHRKGKLQGCYMDKRDGCWYSRIRINGKRIALGRFKTELEGHKAYVAALKEYGV